MREYLTQSNLYKALGLGAIVTAMAVPRILHGRMDPMLYVPAAFMAMTLIAGAGTAWGDRGGMCGLFPGRRRTLAGIGIALLVILVLIPVHLLWIDPCLMKAFSRISDPDVVRLRYPTTLGGMMALMLWTAGFETFFFQVGGMSFCARLTGNQWVAVVFVSTFRMLVTNRFLVQYGIVDYVPLFLVGSAVTGALAAVFFARAGLLATMVFAAGLNLHLVFHLAV